ncbi:MULTISPECIES: acylphosphatase [Pseudovibrio]|uniref:acylphosphatase n=1 Tax=Stappiaceae TaxID=2821832 RepID=UPI0023651265|nr:MULTISPECIES: acylphosphatase [Pseudovibrio]MDD7910662.1 acylphosphatase [Pseudovibrio exalbescens]MDX5594499.1 acylphosphatase [Pseudovibrio sp. SPO723]
MFSVHVMISGRVQGVGYRRWFQQKARGLDLSGWVRNLQDGRVEAQVSGPREKVEALLTAALEGPTFSSVDEVERLGPGEAQDGPFRIAF